MKKGHIDIHSDSDSDRSINKDGICYRLGAVTQYCDTFHSSNDNDNDNHDRSSSNCLSISIHITSPQVGLEMTTVEGIDEKNDKKQSATSPADHFQ